MGAGKNWSVVMRNDPAVLGNLVLREFKYPDDYSRVITLWENAGPGIHVRRSDNKEEIEKKLQRDPDLFLVAEVDGQIIGSVMGGFDGRRGMIYHLAVESSYRKHGIGALLMNELERRMGDKGCIRSYLMVTRDNLEAMQFYSARGWELMDIHIYGKDLDK